MSNIFLEGIEILNSAQDFEYLEDKVDDKLIKEIFRAYKSKVGKIGHYNYRIKEIKELINSDPELMSKIKNKVESSKNRQKIINQIVDKFISVIKDDEEFLNTVQSSTSPADAQIASSVFSSKESLFEVFKNLYHAIAYINKGAQVSKNISQIDISNIKNINDDLFEKIFDQLDKIDNSQVESIKLYLQKNNLIGNSKVLWPNVNIKLPEKLDQNFVNKYFNMIKDQSGLTKVKETKRLSRNSAKAKIREEKEGFNIIEKDLNYLIDDLKTKKYQDDIDDIIEKEINKFINNRSEEKIRNYLIDKSENSRYNFDKGSNIEDSLYEIIATEIHLTRLGRKKK